MDYAVDAAQKYDAEVIDLNVILSYVTIFGPAVPRYMSGLKQEAQSYLDKVTLVRSMCHWNSKMPAQVLGHKIISRGGQASMVQFL